MSEDRSLFAYLGLSFMFIAFWLTVWRILEEIAIVFL